MNYNEQVSGLDLCIKAKIELKKSNIEFLGAHGGVGLDERRYCTFCGNWHLRRHIQVALDYKLEKEKTVILKKVIEQSHKNICKMFEKEGAVLTDESRKRIKDTITQLYKEQFNLTVN
jgi:hypothetical protein